MCPVQSVTYVSGRSHLWAAQFSRPSAFTQTSTNHSRNQPRPCALRRFYGIKPQPHLSRIRFYLFSPGQFRGGAFPRAIAGGLLLCARPENSHQVC
jgi:hypothetical protein